jgi:hypothetical protein
LVSVSSFIRNLYDLSLEKQHDHNVKFIKHVSTYMTYFIIYFRLEIILPTNWFKTMHSVGDRTLQSKTGDSSLHPYDVMHREADAFDYVKKLEKMSQRELIKQILQLEEKN